MQPKCIVLDEPTAMLDPKGRDEVMTTLLKLNREKNMTVVLITHYMEEAVLADRVVVMDARKNPHSGYTRRCFFAGGAAQKSTVLMFRRQQSLHTDSGGAE